MTNSSEQSIDNLFELISDCTNFLKNNSSVIIVEGIKDYRTLIELGINKESIITKGGYNNFQICDIIREKQIKFVIIFVDFDKEGYKILKDVTKELTRLKGVRIESTFRKRLYKIARAMGITEIHDFDNLLHQYRSRLET